MVLYYLAYVGISKLTSYIVECSNRKINSIAILVWHGVMGDSNDEDVVYDDSEDTDKVFPPSAFSIFALHTLRIAPCNDSILPFIVIGPHCRPQFNY